MSRGRTSKEGKKAGAEPASRARKQGQNLQGGQETRGIICKEGKKAKAEPARKPRDLVEFARRSRGRTCKEGKKAGAEPAVGGA